VNDHPADITALIDAAQPLDAPPAIIADARPATPLSSDPESLHPREIEGGDRPDGPSGDYAGDEVGPSDADPVDVDPEVLERCAGFDHSDTDNGQRLIAHFGQDLCVLEQEGTRNLDFLAWTGTHWDLVGGNDAAMRIVQKLGGRIALEADHLTFLPHEQRVLEAAEKASREMDRLEARKADWSDADKARARDLQLQIAAGKEARSALNARQVARRKFAVSSKNKSRLEAMLACAAPHLTRRPDAFNADPLLVATKEHTLRFVREPDDENANADEPRMRTAVQAIEGHRREDLITHLLPVSYDPSATCPKWEAFLERFLPVESVRNCVQVFSGLGLTGLPLQKLLFHYGLGANGKSVFMEVLVRLFGPLAVGLPSESLVGTSERSGSGASPDLARLYGRRVVRVLELPADKPVQEDLVKKLTGGEKIPVRSLFKGFFEFQPVFKAHMSGNGFPRIDGTDNGIWRRLAVIHWPVTIPESEQRNFEDVVSEFREEFPGILNWLIKGALTYLNEGLVLPEEVKSATQEYRDEMDPIGQFATDCVEVADGENVPARMMYDAYVSWCAANAKKPFTETKFGRVMKTKFTRDDSRVRHYVDCRLHHVPTPPPRNPEWDRD
jgi:putative DNA primase/helicase